MPSYELDEIKTIYEKLHYPTRLVDFAVRKALTEKERNFLLFRHSGDLNNKVPNPDYLPGYDRFFYFSILPKLKDYLKSLELKDSKPEMTKPVSRREVAQKKAKQTGNKKSRARKTIYKLCEGYRRELVDEVISELDKEDKLLFDRMNGEDLDHPIYSDGVTDKEKVKYSTALVPKIRRRLKRKSIVSSNQKVSKVDDEVIYVLEKKDSKEVKTSVQTKSVSSEQNSKRGMTQGSVKPPLAKEKSRTRKTIYELCEGYKRGLSEEFILKLSEEEEKLKEGRVQSDSVLLELNSIFSFGRQFFNNLTEMDKMVLLLIFGGYSFSIEKIAEILGIKKEEVLSIMKTVLVKYRDEFNICVDSVVEGIDNDIATKKKVFEN